MIDAAIIFSDILVVPQAMGFDVSMVDGKGPVFRNPLRSPFEIEKINLNPDVKQSFDWALRSISLTRHKLDGEVPLIGFVGSPWTLFVYMTEGGSSRLFEHSKTWIYKYPADSEMVLNSITNVCIEFLAQQVVAGAQILQVFDSHAGELGPEEFNQFSLTYLKRIPVELKRRLEELGVKEKVPLIIFAKNAHYAIKSLSEIGYDVISLDWIADVDQALEIVRGKLIVLQGNLDPGVIYGSYETIARKTRLMINKFRTNGQNHIINFGHGTHPNMNPDKIKFFLQKCRECFYEKELN